VRVPVRQRRRLEAAEVERLDPYVFTAVIGRRIIHPGGRAATEQLLRRAAITGESRVLDVGCGVGATVITIAERFGAQVTAVDISEAGLSNVEIDEGPFEMMSPKGFVQDEGAGRSLSVTRRVMTRRA
jgi:SAM-dependent methyltransferase